MDLITKKKRRRSIGYKFVGYILLCSSIVTLIITAVQVYFDYRVDIRLIENRIDEIERGYQQPLANAVWVSNETMVTLQLEGINRLPDMQYAEVREDNQIIASVGTWAESNTIQKKFPLTRIYNNNEIHVGTFTVIVSLKGVYKRLLNKIIVILTTQTIKTLIVCFCIIFIFYYLMGGHLSSLADFAQSLSVDKFHERYTLKRKQHEPSQYDELDYLVIALNEMKDRIVQHLEIQKITASELRESEQKLRNTIDSTPFPVAVVNLADGKILYWSKSALDLFGHTGRTVSEWAFIAYPDSGYRAEVTLKWNSFLEEAKDSGNTIDTGTYKVTCGNGSIRLCQIFVNCISDNLIVTFSDITKQKHAEDELNRYHDQLENLVQERTAELEAVNKEMETFTYSVSHDLKAPLRGIDGYSKLLAEEYQEKLDADGMTFLQNIRNSATQMNQLIEDLLSYSRMERRDIQITEVNLQLMVESILAQQAHDIETRNINVLVKLPFSEVNCDIETLRQVMGNYIDNAIKFCCNECKSVVEIGGKENSDSWTIWVIDNGIGISSKYSERIFEIFQRLHHAEDFPGTGVGLAIARKAVERIGGKVWVDSEVDKGATFYVSIPKQNNIGQEPIL